LVSRETARTNSRSNPNDSSSPSRRASQVFPSGVQMSSWISAGAAAVAVIWIISLSFADTPTVARFTKRATSYERVTWVDEGWNEAAPPATTTRRRHHHDRSAHVQTELRPGHVRLTPATRLRQHPGRHERTHAADHGLLGGRI